MKRFLYEDVNWKLVEEYAREEIDVIIPLLKILQFFFRSDRNDFGSMKYVFQY